MLSGIGQAEHLEEFGIETLVDLPGVGENFHNHVLTGLIYETKREVPPPRLNIAGEAAMLSSPVTAGSPPKSANAFVMRHSTSSSVRRTRTRSVCCRLCARSRALYCAPKRRPVRETADRPGLSGDAVGHRSSVKTIEIGRDIFSANAFKDWLTGKNCCPARRQDSRAA